MERWIGEWLNVEVAPMATVSATVHLPLMAEADLARVNSGGLDLARHRARLWMHDPESADVQQRRPHHPGAGKQALLREIDALPRRSPERRRAFLEMHQRLGSMRRESASQVDYAQRELAHMERLSQEAETAMRRDWAFPLYPRETLADLAARIRDS
jgi:hypothetical protein